MIFLDEVTGLIETFLSYTGKLSVFLEPFTSTDNWQKKFETQWFRPGGLQIHKKVEIYSSEFIPQRNSEKVAL